MKSEEPPVQPPEAHAKEFQKILIGAALLALVVYLNKQRAAKH